MPIRLYALSARSPSFVGACALHLLKPPDPAVSSLDELIAAVAHKDNSISEADLRTQYGATGIGGISSAIVVAGGGGAAATLARRNALQSYFMNTSRLGIPTSFAHEGLHCGAPWGTCFPMPLLTACSWNDTLPELIGGVLATEARGYGVDNIWSPVG